MPGIRDSISADSSRKTNFTNLILRILQLIFAATVVGFYAYYIKNDFTTVHRLDWKGEESLAITAGSLSIITAITFAIIPALISYYAVAIAFIWDIILFFVWCAVFGWFRGQDAIKHAAEQPDARVDYIRFAQMNWINLINLLLWLMTAFMSIVCLLHDRKSLKFIRSGV